VVRVARSDASRDDGVAGETPSDRDFTDETTRPRVVTSSIVGKIRRFA
jgi:hypothetical protein